LPVRQPNVAEESPELGMACRRERHAGRGHEEQLASRCRA
jgi:hypothetical protein